ncbi:MAG: lipid-A-disaccharide synthase [Bacteroidales bacterium]|jgi:lipid-A-disaccharide synthase|nr:lipid-A-disaccharide synthase [Bacteroidales bacterium]MCI2121135.1 lipid-A-disaccharide synthase [Bacteroidales bacterium]MCI2144725.1 lipid-A-disaccharide synthase [Bacteroidales bacterium]
MRLYFIAGEASGDLHGSNLIKAILKVDPSASIRGIGGEKMREAGAEIWKDYSQTAVMGYTAVILRLGDILKNMRECRKDIVAWRPDAIVLIDYPGFNLEMAKFAHGRGIRVFYYIAPKVWAWKGWRIKQLRKYVDNLFVIFPFEVPFFAKHGIKAIYEGNPLMDSISADASLSEDRKTFLARNGLEDKPIIALLPGSRKMEISFLMPRFAEYERLLSESPYKGYQLVLAEAPELDDGYVRSFLSPESRISIVKGATYSVLKNAECAVIASGTATLEAAIIGTLQTAVYGGGAFSFAVAHRLVKIKLYTLPNIIMGHQVFRELVQGDCTAENIYFETDKLLGGGEYASGMRKEYAALRDVLGNPGASDRIAHVMIGLLNTK